MGQNLWQDPTKTIPTSDNQIIRVNMEELEIGGRKSHLPGQSKSAPMVISHVGNAGTKV